MKTLLAIFKKICATQLSELSNASKAVASSFGRRSPNAA
jgi:hypothetical protein